MKKNILIIGTGGTIAGKGKKGETAAYDSAQIQVDDLASEIPELAELANLDFTELFSVDSCDVSFDKLLKLAKYINEKATDNKFDGFVVTHGTDTLEETAYFLNLTVKTEKPVVITGAMRPSTAISADGPFNLYQAVALATKDEAAGKGIMVVFSDSIFGARDISKINTFRTDAFNQRDFGCLGYMRDDKAYFFNESTKLHTSKSEFDIQNINKLPRVDIATFCLDAQTDILDYFADRSEGIILAGAGCGGSKTEWNEKITEILSLGKPIVRSSRVGNGLVTYGKDKITEKGIFAGSLSPQKARILLSLALTKTKNLNEIQEIFEKY
ncbi:MAG: asparaginase [Clostridia bacterium]|nr:asparaginase [Clostridia bacterium]